MLKGRIVTPLKYAWVFPIVVDTEKDGKPRAYIEYSSLNQIPVADTCKDHLHINLALFVLK